MDSSQNVQQMAYHMLREAAVKYTEHVVVEAAVDTDAVIKPELPSELIDILHRSIELVDQGEDLHGQVRGHYATSFQLTLKFALEFLRISTDLDAYV